MGTATVDAAARPDAWMATILRQHGCDAYDAEPAREPGLWLVRETPSGRIICRASERICRAMAAHVNAATYAAWRQTQPHAKGATR